MARNLLKLIIALLAIAALAVIIIRRSKKKAEKANSGEEPDWIEFPSVRAHVYFATQDRCVEALKSASMDIPNCSIAFAADNSLLICVPESEISLRVFCQPLGPTHTRVVIASAYSDDSSSTALIKAIQSLMDKLLIGG